MKTINSFRSKLLALTFALVASVSTFAYDFVFANDFHIDGFGYRIISNNEPRAVELREIADCTEDVVIPATVTYNGLQYIVSTVGMGGSIITNDARITIKSIFIPKTIQVVNMRALSDCPHLCSIVVDEENPYLDSRNDCNAIVTSKDWGSPANTLIAGCQTTTIPNSVTVIGDYAFYRCDSLKHMTVPNGVTTINNGAFSECSSLSSIKLPESLTNLSQQWIFDGCTSLKEVFFFAKTPPYIAYGMFRGLNPTIFVPKESLDAYKKALYWQDFDIQTIPYKSQWCDTWNTLCSTNNQTPVAQTWQYTLGQDTIIEGKTYTIVNRHWTIDPENTEEYVASVRFTNDDKVFVFYDNTEYLLYDFNVQVDDSVEVFAGINNYDYAKTYKGRVYDISYAENGVKICKISVPVSTYDDGYVSGGTYYSATWIEGIGDAQFGLLFGYVPGAKNEYSYSLLCAYKGDELMHETDHYLFDTYGCEYNGEIYIPRFFEGLQRTECSLHPTGVDSTYLVSCDRFVRYVIKNKLYWKDINSGSFFRETKDQIILSFPHGGGEECVLYDFSLEVGDTLPVMQYDEKTRGEMFRVVDVSMVTLLDGKEYKKWTLACGYEYIEKIGAINGKGLGNYVAFGPNADAATYLGSPLVCASRNGKLLYQMDDAEMERLNTECLCEIETSYKSQWCDTWNVFVENGSVYPPHEETYRYQLAQDIVIGDYTYTAVVSKAINDALDAPHYVAAVRFTDDRKVYIYYDNAEYLLYDFNVQQGDELEVFAGINNYTSEIKTYKCTVTGVEQYAYVGCPATITLEVHNHPDDFREFYRLTQWIEGVGDINGFLNGINHYVEMDGGGSEYLLCAHKGDELKYTGDLYEEYGCGDDAEQSPEDLFPTLWGLQRTSCDEWLEGCGENKSYLFAPKEVKEINGKLYLKCGGVFLREEDSKVLIYSFPYEKDFVLYDWTLEIGDTLQNLGIDPYSFPELEYAAVVDYIVYEDYDVEIGDFIIKKEPLGNKRVKDISTIRLLDGNEYKAWLFGYDWERGDYYVEGIGNANKYGGDYVDLAHPFPVPTCYYGERLVCVSRNGKLLYQMDDAEMERLGTECLCKVETSYKSQWCDTWNVMWFDGMRFDETASTSKYRLGKDTIIGDYTYSKFTSRTSVRFTDDKKVYVYYEGFDDNDPYTPDLPTGEYLAYDFSAQVGDTLEVFSGVHSYSKYKCLVREVQTDPETKLRTITLFQLLLEDTDGDGVEEEYALGEMTWIEGVGSPNGFLIGTTLPGGGTYALLCAYKDDELKYTGDLYDEYGCEYNATEQKPEDLFPTLWGLQRTSFTEYSECSDSYASLFQSKGETITINHNQYLKFGGHYLREENKQVLLYSRLQDKDLVLYDYSLEVGDTLTTLNIDYRIEGIPFDLCYVDYAYEDVGMSHSIDTLIVTDVSYVTLLDGKEHKQWTFDNGMQYVEGIGNFGQSRWSGNFFGLVKEPAIPPCLIGEHLVCVSKNGKLLYQMDEAEMERLGAECLCEYNSGPKKDNAKNGKIGGRPTPTQWNMLEVETKEMDGTPTILRAETFSYTLENDSIVTKGKTFYQLARQSTKDTAITKSFVGALHFGEDEDNRVYFLRDGVEYVLYDFTAEPGDTVKIFAGINNYPQETTYTHVVVDKDTTEDGACRMFLEVVFPDETTTATNAEKVWLAGLGSIDGIVHNAAKRTSDVHAAPAKSASSETQTSVMLCAWREDSCLYTTNYPEYDTFGCVYNQDPTAVEDVQTSGDKYQKIIRDGHLYILRDNKLYDVLGTPMN